MDGRSRDIVSMPRGGPDASWLDRRLQTNRLEPGPRRRRRSEAQGRPPLDRGGRRRWFGTYERFARMVLGEVADVPSPKILELGSGLGGLSSKLVENHPTAQVTVTDIEPTFVAAGTAPLGGVGGGAAVHWAGPADTRWVRQLATRLQPVGAACDRPSCRPGDYRRVPHPTVWPDGGGCQSRQPNCHASRGPRTRSRWTCIGRGAVAGGAISYPPLLIVADACVNFSIGGTLSC